MKKFNYEEARKRVETITGKPTYLVVEGEERENDWEIEKPVEKFELQMKANPDETSSILRITRNDGVFEEQVHCPRGQKAGKPIEELEVEKGEESHNQLEKKRLELDKQQKEAETKRQAALIDAEKYKQQAEEVQRKKNELDAKLLEQRPQVHQLPRNGK